MLVFGPYRALPDPAEEYVIFNMTSFNEDIPRLPGLIVDLPEAVSQSDDVALAFDMWYYDYITSKNLVAFSSMMTILMALYNNGKVYVCISDYVDSFLNTINESFIKILQQRYGLRCTRINVNEDWENLEQYGSDFTTYGGLDVFDDDRDKYIKYIREGLIVPWNIQISGIG